MDAFEIRSVGIDDPDQIIGLAGKQVALHDPERFERGVLEIVEGLAATLVNQDMHKGRAWRKDKHKNGTIEVA